jgi:hypothetical protein
MRFQVPQFIEIEDKIFGPLTITQFVYLAGGFGFLGACALMLPLWAAVILGGPVAVLGLALAFYKVNDRPLITVMEHALNFYVKEKLYIWKKDKAKPEEVAQRSEDRDEDPAQFAPAATGNKIKDLAWSLDIHESLYTDKNQK